MRDDRQNHTRSPGRPVTSLTLPWARFAARSFPYLGQNLNETCKDSPHVEQNIASKEGEGAA